jgi:hypothetical protein
LRVSDSMQYADWYSLDLIGLMLCDELRCVAGGWLTSASASGAMV